MDLMDLIGYAVSLLFLITIPPVSTLIMLVCWIYHYFTGRLNNDYVMTEEEEAELRNMIKDLLNDNEEKRY